MPAIEPLSAGKYLLKTELFAGITSIEVLIRWMLPPQVRMIRNLIPFSSLLRKAISRPLSAACAE